MNRWTYQTEKELDGQSHWGRITSYSGGGFTLLLEPTKQKTARSIEVLKVSSAKLRQRNIWIAQESHKLANRCGKILPSFQNCDCNSELQLKTFLYSRLAFSSQLTKAVTQSNFSLLLKLSKQTPLLHPLSLLCALQLSFNMVQHSSFDIMFDMSQSRPMNTSVCSCHFYINEPQVRKVMLVGCDW